MPNNDSFRFGVKHSRFISRYMIYSRSPRFYNIHKLTIRYAWKNIHIAIYPLRLPSYAVRELFIISLMNDEDYQN